MWLAGKKFLQLWCALIAITLLLTAPTNSNAAIVYSGPMDIAPWFPLYSFPPWINLDLNNDGTDDFVMDFNVIATTSYPVYWIRGMLHITALNSNSVLRNGYYSASLEAHQAVPEISDPSADWSSGSAYSSHLIADWSIEVDEEAMTAVPTGWLGPLAGLGNGLLGLYFHAADGAHYGWIEVNLNTNAFFDDRPSIRGWAYETEPGVTLQTIPEPRALALLFAGLAAMVVTSIRRRNGSQPRRNRHSAVGNRHSSLLFPS